MGFNDFLMRGLVEYVDVNEENNSLIALYEKDLTPQVKHRCLGFFFGRNKFKGPRASHEKPQEGSFVYLAADAQRAVTSAAKPYRTRRCAACEGVKLPHSSCTG